MDKLVRHVPSHALGQWFTEMLEQQPQIAKTILQMMEGG